MDKFNRQCIYNFVQLNFLSENSIYYILHAVIQIIITDFFSA